MNTTLAVVVSAIVILITALVVITIFGGSMGGIVEYTAQKNLCMQQGGASCSMLGVVPPTWAAPLQYREGTQIKTAKEGCKEILDGCKDCDTCHFEVPKK